MALQDFYEQIKDCQKCALASSRTQVVFGYGNPHAHIMLVGEAPGFHEDRQDILFTILPSRWWPSNRQKAWTRP
jgi:uracil-DNA glycosylase